jgi:hypothetical protein
MISKIYHYDIKIQKGKNMPPPKKKTPMPTPELGLEPKTVTLRIPDKLFGFAQQCSQASGLSLNGLICSALADYLSSRGYKVHPPQK